MITFKHNYKENFKVDWLDRRSIRMCGILTALNVRQFYYTNLYA